MQENEPVYSSSDCAVLVGDHNVAGYALSARARAPLTLEGSDKIFHHSGGNRVQACGRLVIHHYLWVGHMLQCYGLGTCTTLLQHAHVTWYNIDTTGLSRNGGTHYNMLH